MSHASCQSINQLRKRWKIIMFLIEKLILCMCSVLKCSSAQYIQCFKCSKFENVWLVTGRLKCIFRMWNVNRFLPKMTIDRFTQKYHTTTNFEIKIYFYLLRCVFGLRNGIESFTKYSGHFHVAIEIENENWASHFEPRLLV